MTHKSQVVLKSKNNDLPKIIGYFDKNLNCVFSAIVRKTNTTIKHMVVYPEADTKSDVLSRVEMNFCGYGIQPVIVEDMVSDIYTKAKPNLSKTNRHWAIGWFKADYMRWLTLTHHGKVEVEKILGSVGDKKKSFSSPTTSFITSVSLSKLLAAHVCYAHAIDTEDGEASRTASDLLDMYIDELGLVKRHGNSFRAKVINLMDPFVILDAVHRDKTLDPTIGVDTFIKL